MNWLPDSPTTNSSRCIWKKNHYFNPSMSVKKNPHQVDMVERVSCLFFEKKTKKKWLLQRERGRGSPLQLSG